MVWRESGLSKQQKSKQAWGQPMLEERAKAKAAGLPTVSEAEVEAGKKSRWCFAQVRANPEQGLVWAAEPLL